MKLAFFCVVGVHVAALMVALLSQGCKKPEQTTTDSSQLSTMDTNLPALPDTNTAYVAPTNVTPAIEPPVAPSSQQQEYVILRGDTYSTIARKYPGVTVKAIQDANPGVDPLKLQPGKKIVIPAATAAPVALGGTGALPASVTGEQVYVVKSGDTLTTIASHHGTTVKALRAANNLTTDKIKVGQRLKIPAKSATPVEPVPAPPPAR